MSIVTFDSGMSAQQTPLVWLLMAVLGQFAVLMVKCLKVPVFAVLGQVQEAAQTAAKKRKKLLDTLGSFWYYLSKPIIMSSLK